MAAVVNWPPIRPRDVSFFLRWNTRSVGRSLGGREQFVSTNSAQWEVTLGLGTEFDGDALRAFEGRVAMMEGRKNVALFPLCDALRYGSAYSPRQEPFSDGTWFVDGTGWIVEGAGAQPFVVTTARPVGATSLVVIMTEPSRRPLRLGDLFSNDDFIYRVTGADAAGNVTFTPPLRSGIAAGGVIRTDPAWFKGRFATDDEGRRTREMLRWGEPITLRFVEAFDR